ncbi:MAG: PhoX family protein [Bdellovibrionales bacterium]
MMTRRNFLEFLGKTSILSTTAMTGCTWGKSSSAIPHLPTSNADTFQTVAGINWNILIKAFDPISKKDNFGQDNDYLGYIPLDPTHPLEGFLWANHEIYRPQYLTGWDSQRSREPRSPERLKLERYQVGGSLLHVKKTSAGWKVIQDSNLSRRYTGETPIPFSNSNKILGSSQAKGTLGNCCGGLTPWGTFLSCEENYHHFYGESVFDPATKKYVYKPANHRLAWDTTDPQPPEHYGWVNEINPRTGHIQKIVELGRFAHEGATVVTAHDGRIVVYMGDDSADQCFYKFVSNEKGNINSGTLYVANTTLGKWIPLDVNKNSELKKRFGNQTELLIRTRDAAHLVGGTPLDRPEDCEVDPINRDIYLTCTNNKNNPHGHILKLSESGADHLAETFTSTIFLRGGKDSGFSSPDNLAFDKNGNLWMVSDMDDDKPGYEGFGNNGLFFIPTRGQFAGLAHRLAIAPIKAELTGLFFAPDNETLFLSVQHPGGTSHWPEGGSADPKSAVVTLSGPTLQRLMNLKA